LIIFKITATLEYRGMERNFSVRASIELSTRDLKFIAIGDVVG
jgi:hypothetical protein